MAREQKQMPLLGNMGAPVFGEVNIIKFNSAYKSLSCRAGTNPVVKDGIAAYPYNC